MESFYSKNIPDQMNMGYQYLSYSTNRVRLRPPTSLYAYIIIIYCNSETMHIFPL